MRLFKRGEVYFVEFERGSKRSLKTKDKREAQALFKELKEQFIKGELTLLKKPEIEVTITELIEKYISHPDRSELSPKTYEADTLALRQLRDAIGDINLNNFELKHIVQFKQYCKNLGLKSVSINTYLRHIKAALNFGVKQEWITGKMPDIKYLKLPTTIIRVIPPNDIHTLLNESKVISVELYRVIIFALYTGCRRGEIMGLKYEDIDWQRKIIRVKGKGNKERLVLMLPQVEEALERQDKGLVFSKYKDVASISKIFHKVAVKCNITARFHDLRHTAATQMLSSGIPIDVVQSILGHSAISTTQIYAQVVAERMSQEMGKLQY